MESLFLRERQTTSLQLAKPSNMATPTPTASATKRGKKKNLALPPYSLQSSHNNNTVDDLFEKVAHLLKGRKNIVVLVGAGISTSVGIPDFRSKDKGLYNTLDAHSLGLSCPEDLFCIEFFRSNPRPFYKFAKHLYYPNQPPPSKKAKPKRKPPSRTSRRIKSQKQQPSQSLQEGRASPSDSHKLLALLERNKMLLRVYTQNIDGLEASAGVSDSKIVYCHGSLRSMSCTLCSKKNLTVDEHMLASIRDGSVPVCLIPSKKKTAAKSNGIVSPTRTSNRKKRPRSLMEGAVDHSNNFGLSSDRSCCGGVLKPSITFFGETLDHSVARKIESDQNKADALIVIGTSLSVAPISKVIEYLPMSIPRILINKTIVHPKSSSENASSFRKNYVFDAYLLGSCDDVTRALGKQMGLGLSTDKANKTVRKNSTTKKKEKRENQQKPTTTNYASETGATIWSDNHQVDWNAISVPKERVLLFPGALIGQEQQVSPSYQEIAHCDGCSKMIPVGKPIFKCSECFDYDLCQSCYPRVAKMHCDGKHSFQKE